MRAEADRLPALRFRDRDGDNHVILARLERDIAAHPDALAIGAGDGHVHPSGLRAVRDHRGTGEDTCFRIGQRLLLDAKIVDARGIPRLQAGGAPDADIDDARCPVPAILVFRLADIGGGLNPLRLVTIGRVILAGQGMLLGQHHRLERLDRRGEGDDDLVRARLQQRLGIGPPATMRIVRRQQALSVDRNGREGVEPVEHQVQVIAAQHLRCHVQTGAILPPGQARPLDRGLVRTLIGIGDDVGGDQVLLHAARHSRGQPVRRLGMRAGGGGVLRIDPHLPAVERRHRLLRGQGGEGQGERGQDQTETMFHSDFPESGIAAPGRVDRVQDAGLWLGPEQGAWRGRATTAGQVPDRARLFLAIRHPRHHRLVVRRYSHGMFWYHGEVNGGRPPLFWCDRLSHCVCNGLADQCAMPNASRPMIQISKTTVAMTETTSVISRPDTGPRR